jgi:hypothetical protein
MHDPSYGGSSRIFVDPRRCATKSEPVKRKTHLFDILQIPDPLGVIFRRWKLRGNEIRWLPTR